MVQEESQTGIGGAPKTVHNNITDNTEDNILPPNEEKGCRLSGKAFDRERFVRCPDIAIQIARMDEASYSSRWSDSIVGYVEDSCNCFGPSHIKIINDFTDEEYFTVFREASSIVDRDPEYEGIQNPRAYLSSVIQKQIAKRKKERGERA